MKLTTALMGAAAAVALAPAAFAERGSDGELKIIYWQAPSIMNPYLSGGTKDIEAAALVIEPLARYDETGALIPWLVEEIPTSFPISTPVSIFTPSSSTNATSSRLSSTLSL